MNRSLRWEYSEAEPKLCTVRKFANLIRFID